MKSYLDLISNAVSLPELDAIICAAAADDTLTHAEYTALYSAALKKAQGAQE